MSNSTDTLIVRKKSERVTKYTERIGDLPLLTKDKSWIIFPSKNLVGVIYDGNNDDMPTKEKVYAYFVTQ